MRVLITRPWEDAEPLAAALRTHAIDSEIAPLLDIRYRGGPALDLRGVQVMLATSANGVRAFAARQPDRDLPVYAVGEATARVARANGFAAVEVASGDVAALAGLVRDRLDPAAGALIHAAGTSVAGDLAGMLKEDGFLYRREVLYEARVAESLPPAAVKGISERSLDGVVLYSPRTAATFVKLVQEAGLDNDCHAQFAFCLSHAVADRVASISWKSIVVAIRPEQSAMVRAIIAVDKKR